MSSYETTGCLFGVGAGLLLATMLGNQFGWPGALAGFVVGMLGGFVVGWFFVELNFATSVYFDRRTRRRRLSGAFGQYWSTDQDNRWRQIKTELMQGDSLSGAVVAEFYYGVFVDAGKGFPALLTKLETRKTDEELTLGRPVTARIAGWDDQEHIIQLSQRNEPME